MRKKFVFSILMFFFIWFVHESSYAKYVDDIKIDVANIKLDRTRPKMIYQWSTVNKYITSEGEKYDITFEMIIQEKNLVEDKINMDKITTWVDDVEAELEIIITEIEHTEEEHRYKIEAKGIASKRNFKLNFEQGAVRDVAGWTNILNEVDIQTSI